MLIAVNYEARKYGVSRIDKADDALRKCPSLRLFKTEIRHGKVVLDRYRLASIEIFEVFRQFGVCERGGVDEAYIDVSERVATEMANRALWRDDPVEYVADRTRSHFFAGVLPAAGSAADTALCFGARIAEELRETLRRQKGYTCSVGIARNRQLAKMATSKHKPFQQTVVCSGAIEALMHDTAIHKVPGLGGKLGSILQKEFGLAKAGDLLPLSVAELATRVGQSNAEWLFAAARGLVDSPVSDRDKRLSMGSSRNFSPALTVFAQAADWLDMFCRELEERVLGELALTGRWPKTMTLHVRMRRGMACSRSCSMPPHCKEMHSSLFRTALALHARVEHPFPCTNMGLIVHGLPDQESRSAGTIATFFGPSSSGLKPADERESEPGSDSDLDLAAEHPDSQPSDNSSSSSEVEILEARGPTVAVSSLQCKWCGAAQFASARALQEHTDRHVAQDVALEGGSAANAGLASGREEKRRRLNPQGPSIAAFFGRR
eukprot:TRINITY_DN6915_c0_g1_i2.p1 TRINITY_DN6915_c0_g1~~TRINITY_DN6915_c0_g1_i2.p1  ORF type:complete len:527 (-),score=95.21 TRINITY_DN6915_c0_g1_i2:7-1482(-)